MNIEKELSTLYSKFGSDRINQNYNAVRLFLEMINANSDQEEIETYLSKDDLRLIEKIPDVFGYISELAKTNGSSELCNFIDGGLKNIKTEPKKQINFFWLDTKVKNEILSMNPSQRVTFYHSLRTISTDKSRLSANFTDVGFADTGNSHLRDFKKTGKNGYRIYFALNGDNVIIIGKSSAKSNTDVIIGELEKFTSIAIQAESVDVSTLSPVEILNESTVGLCIMRSVLEEKNAKFKNLNESSIDGLEIMQIVINNKNCVCFIDPMLDLTKIENLNKEDFISGILTLLGTNSNVTVDDVVGFLLIK